jgi:hypothetical protein
VDAVDRALSVIATVFSGAVPAAVDQLTPRPHCPMAGALAECLSEVDTDLCRWCTEAEIGETLANLRVRAGLGMTYHKYYDTRAEATLPRWKRGREPADRGKRIPPNPWRAR